MTLVTARRELSGGGSDRLADLYQRHVADARRFAYLLCGDEHAAADIVQEAFLRVASRLGALRNTEAFPAYLRATVRNVNRMRVRAQTREDGRVDRHERARVNAAPQGDASDDARDDDLWRTLMQLPERQRTAVVCRYYLDLSERETAKVLSCRPGTVKSLVSRALATLRENRSIDG
jgi:RNA polymerase sigma factor (sigma-70 family)